MKEHALLLSAPMVRAYFAGRKRVTRRILSKRNTLIDGMPWGKSKCKWEHVGISKGILKDGVLVVGCERCLHVHSIEPIYLPGDMVWFKETLEVVAHWGQLRYAADGSVIYDQQFPKDGHDALQVVADALIARYGRDLEESGYVPSIFMPHRLSRIVFPVVGARIEYLQDITEADAKREGVEAIYPKIMYPDEPLAECNYIRGVIKTWEILRPKPGQRWKDNPLVIAIEFNAAKDREAPCN